MTTLLRCRISPAPNLGEHIYPFLNLSFESQIEISVLKSEQSQDQIVPEKDGHPSFLLGGVVEGVPPCSVSRSRLPIP